MNDSNFIRDTLLKAPTLPVKQCSVIWKWTQISCKCILQTFGQPLKNFFKRSIIGMLRKERKWNQIKCSIKNREGWKGENERYKKWIQWFWTSLWEDVLYRGTVKRGWAEGRYKVRAVLPCLFLKTLACSLLENPVEGKFLLQERGDIC